MIDILVDEGSQLLAEEALLRQAVRLTCSVSKQVNHPSLCLRFAADETVQQLNAEWRHQDKVTDVLSFPMLDDEEWASVDANMEIMLGDIILAAPFVGKEAVRLSLNPADHAVHLTVHGTLHLLGFDHINDHDADVMQAWENQILAQLGLHQPYETIVMGNI